MFHRLPIQASRLQAVVFVWISTTQRANKLWLPTHRAAKNKHSENNYQMHRSCRILFKRAFFVYLWHVISSDITEAMCKTTLDTSDGYTCRFNEPLACMVSMQYRDVAECCYWFSGIKSTKTGHKLPTCASILYIGHINELFLTEYYNKNIFRCRLAVFSI